MSRAVTPERIAVARHMLDHYPWRVVQRTLGLAPATLFHLRARGWAMAKLGRPPRPMPEGFAARAGDPVAMLARDFRTSHRAVRRWRAELAGEAGR